MDKIDYIVKPVFTFFSWFAILAILLIAVITVANILSRLFLNHSLLGSIEIPQLAMVIVSFGALPVVSAFNGHIKVDLLVEKFSARGQAALTVLNLILSGTVLLFLAKFTFIRAAKAFTSHICTTNLSIPHYPFYYAMAIFMVFTSFICYYNIIHLLLTGSTLNSRTFAEVTERIKKGKAKGEKRNDY